jgi:hypothetical protein
MSASPQKRTRHSDTERPGGLEVQKHLNFRGLLDRQVGRLLANENAAGVDAGSWC